MPPAGELQHSPEKQSANTQPSEAEAAEAILASSSDAEAAGLWTQIKAEAHHDAEEEPALASYLYSTILSHSSLERSISFHLGNKLCSSTLLSTLLYDLFLNNNQLGLPKTAHLDERGKKPKSEVSESSTVKRSTMNMGSRTRCTTVPAHEVSTSNSFGCLTSLAVA